MSRETVEIRTTPPRRVNISWADPGNTDRYLATAVGNLAARRVLRCATPSVLTWRYIAAPRRVAPRAPYPGTYLTAWPGGRDKRLPSARGVVAGGAAPTPPASREGGGSTQRRSRDNFAKGRTPMGASRLRQACAAALCADYDAMSFPDGWQSPPETAQAQFGPPPCPRRAPAIWWLHIAFFWVYGLLPNRPRHLPAIAIQCAGRLRRQPEP